MLTKKQIAFIERKITMLNKMSTDVERFRNREMEAASLNLELTAVLGTLDRTSDQLEQVLMIDEINKREAS